MADEGFREIQLDKKQLFFAGMAAALYSVVVFSLGVWVGQDVRRPDTELAADAGPDTPADSTPEPTKVAPNELDYAARLSDGKSAAPAGGTTTPPDTKPVEPPTPPETEPPAAEAPKSEPAPAAKAPAPEKSAPAVKTPPAPARTGSVVLQVGAFNDAKTAENLAARLRTKGYAASVFTATSGLLRHKVRVGPFADKAEADRVSARLKKEEGFTPFITR